MAAYYNNARVGVNKTHNNSVVGTPETPGAAAKRVVMDTPSMHNVAAAAAAARPLADVTETRYSDGDALEEPSEARSLLIQQATSDLNAERYQYQLDPQTI